MVLAEEEDTVAVLEEFGQGYGYGRKSDDDAPKDSNKDDEE
ncbi:MAG: hypothetical protein U5K00_10130 [Melioribacteraceae bacterium]|nr:hypothetical protein [Melioribacteraceae bacterium]